MIPGPMLMTPEEIRDLIHQRAVELHADDDEVIEELTELYALTDDMCRELDAPTEDEVWAKFLLKWGDPLEFCRE